MKSIQIFVLFSLALYINSANLSQTAPTCCDKDHTMSISGTGRIFIPTNVIRVGFTIETKELEAQQSFSKNNEIATKVNQILLTEARVPEKNITTINYQISPRYIQQYVESNRTYVEVFDGYFVSNQIDVKLSQKETATKIIDSIVKAGVTRVNYINFDIEPEVASQAKKKILAMAVLEAFNKAKIIANNSNLQIVDVLTISVNEPYAPSLYTPNVSFAMAAAGPEFSMADSKAIYTGQQQLTLTANVLFIIKKSS
jgi:uncharacterized protein